MDFWLVIFCTRLIPSSRWGPMLSFRWCFRSGGSASSPKPEPTFGCSDSTFWHQIGEPKASRTGLKVFLAAHLKNILMQYHNIAASYPSQSHEHFSCDISKPKCKQKPFPQDYPAREICFQVHLEQGGKENAEVEKGWEVWKGWGENPSPLGKFERECLRQPLRLEPLSGVWKCYMRSFWKNEKIICFISSFDAGTTKSQHVLWSSHDYLFMDPR